MYVSTESTLKHPRAFVQGTYDRMFQIENRSLEVWQSVYFSEPAAIVVLTIEFMDQLTAWYVILDLSSQLDGPTAMVSREW